jgi:hypothetical protein
MQPAGNLSLMPAFEIILKNEKTRFYRVISRIFIFIHLIAFLYITIYSPEKNVRLAAAGGLTALLLCIIILYFFRSPGRKYSFRLLFLLCWLGWLVMGNYWLVPVPIIFDLLYYASTQPKVSRFSEDLIIYPSFPARKIGWSQVSNVILREGLITIDLKSNKLIQQEVDEDKTRVDEEEFNEFCRGQLQKWN